MADTLDVLTLEEARAALSRSRVDNADATLLAIYITAVSRFLDIKAGPIVQRSITELHDGGTERIWPSETPVASVTTLTEYSGTTGTALTAESNTVKPANGYLLDSDGRHGVRIWRRSSGYSRLFTSGQQNISLVYAAGRAATTAAVGHQFKLAAQLMLTHVWRAEKGAGSDTFGALDTGVPSFALPNSVRDLLYGELRVAGFA